MYFFVYVSLTLEAHVQQIFPHSRPWSVLLIMWNCLFLVPQLLSACCIPASTVIWGSHTSSRGSGPAWWGASQCSSVSTTPVWYPFNNVHTSDWEKSRFIDSICLLPYSLKKWYWRITNSMLVSHCWTLSLTNQNTETRLCQQRAALPDPGSLVFGPVVDVWPVKERLRFGHHHCLLSHCVHTAAGLQRSLPVRQILPSGFLLHLKWKLISLVLSDDNVK